MDYNLIFNEWISNPLLCAEGLSELNSIKDDEEAKEYRFGTELAFGTAGMRGILGYGTNMMNIYTKNIHMTDYIKKAMRYYKYGCQ